ncbi:MAG: thioesterase [Magnetococcales bacterium]|nr:thioesterase [Magnetococcales bacterium]|tara:strand:+ start:562565 stop:563047 length:483 start_codon:yes stop_codon:yes gene_type:complete
MILYFRLILVTLKILWANWRSPLVSRHHDITFHVLPTDMDLNRHMNNARYHSWMDLGRYYMLGRYGLLKAIFGGDGWQGIIGGVHIRFLRPLNFGQKVTLRTEIESFDEKYFYISQTFLVKGKVAAKAHVKGIMVTTERKIRPREVIRRVLGAGVKIKKS